VRGKLDVQVAQLADALGSGEAELRAALMVSTMLGVTIAHQLLGLTALRDASPERIAEALRPSLRSLADG